MKFIDYKNHSWTAHMLRCVLTILALSFFGLSASAGIITIKGKVRDKASGFEITDADYRLLALPDSNQVAKGKTVQRYITGNSFEYKETIIPEMKISYVDDSKKYILEITYDRYEPVYLEIDPSKMSKKEVDYDLGVIEMKKTRTLDDFTVTATKVKFYNKGDTLIYNADAFQLAEGSMLDALIAQLPGAELKGDEIFVNGRKVESLLLNSKDFFKGNNKIMLENLGAYTVKNIAVYEGQKEEDKIMGKNYGEKELTMDVRLKKEYQIGFILNAEAGYGIKNKFLGRLFGLWFNNIARVSFYGNANNNSNTWKPNQNGTSSMPWTTAQDITTYAGGADYDVSIPNSPMSFSGNASATYTKTKGNVRTYTTNFLPGGDTYGYSFDNSRLTSLEVYTEHSVKAQKDNWNWQITPKFKYNKNTTESKLIGATFNREWDDIDRSFLEGIYSGNSNQVLASMINRNIQDQDKNGNSAWFNIWTNGKRKVNSTDAISYLAAYTYERKHDVSDQLMRINYDDNIIPALNDRRHFDVTPNFNWRAKGYLAYIWQATRNLNAEIGYTYQRYYSRTVSELFRSEDYIENQADNNLNHFAPSALNSFGTFDPANSFNSRYNEETHDINFQINYQIANGVSLWVRMPLTMRRQWLHYLRGDVDARLKRNKFILGNTSASMNIHFGKSKPVWLYIGYNHQVTAPDMVNMVDFTNDLDPLNVIKGNPDLKDSNSENVNIYYSQKLNQARNMTQSYSLDATFYRNSLAYGYNYDRTTGVKTGMMYNVMGNAQYGAGQGFSTDFGRLNCMNIRNHTRFDYRRSADMLSTEDYLPTKNIVNTYGINEIISLGYTHSAFRLTGEADVKWNRFTSHQSGFVPFNAWNMRYTLSGNFILPANFEINTDFNIYARRGYSEPSLNKTNYVWNARVTYKMMKGNLLFMLDGFDILHNLSNINYAVNAQARTETYTGVVPRYFMFHIQWKFHKQPLKK